MLIARTSTLTLAFPESWNECTLGQVAALDKATTDYDKLRAICSQPDALADLPDPTAGDELMAKLPFLETQAPGYVDWPVPDVLTIAGKPVACPGGLSMESYGQKLAFERLAGRVYDYELIREVVAIYLYPAWSGEKFRFQITDTTKLGTLIDALPAHQVLPLAAFFLRNSQTLISSGRITYRSVKTTTTPSTNWLRRWWVNFGRTRHMPSFIRWRSIGA